jgi:hypothetical protein
LQGIGDVALTFKLDTDWKLQKFIAEGSYGRCYEALALKGHNPICVKVIKVCKLIIVNLNPHNPLP